MKGVGVCRNPTGEAEALRAAGNKAFGAGKFEEAIDAYTKSIAVREDTRTFSNRSACWIKLGVAEYQSRRKTAGKSHQICDGVSKVVRWVPDASPSAMAAVLSACLSCLPCASQFSPLEKEACPL
eukprot:6199724-Pleurochrysis_carterae.AAC.2